LRFNADTGANYSTHTLVGYGAVDSFANANSTSIFINGAAAGNSVANKSAGAVIDILDVYNTSKYPTVRALAGADDLVGLSSGSWRNLASITSITLGPRYGTNLTAPSRFSLYGIKG
jgi:hypothetical protein